jgi:hypothetical protein
MVSFLAPAGGGIQPINGRAGSLVEDLKKANQGTPGRDIVVNTVNQIIAASQIYVPPNACDPQAVLQRMQQQAQQKIQLILEQHIQQQVEQDVRNSAPIQEFQRQIQSLRQNQEITASINQQIEILEKDIQKAITVAIVGVIARVSTQLPQVAKAANTSTTGLKTIATVAESLATFVPSQGINMSAYGSIGQKGIQTISQACSI